MEKKRSVGVMVVGSILTGISLLFLIMAFITFVISPRDRSVIVASVLNPVGFILILQLIAGIGILCLKQWARRLVMWVAGSDIILGVLFLVLFTAGAGEPSFGLVLLIMLLLSFGSFLTYFFTRSKVKEQFK